MSAVRRRLLMAIAQASAGPTTLPAIGDAFMGGYYAGIIDTTVGNIAADDTYQTGKRYALIVAPLSLEASGTSWSSSVATVTAAKTRWNGLTATAAMTSATYPAANYCAGLTPPADAASAWYLPALDELELIYRNLKPTTESNNTATFSSPIFPAGGQPSGTNPSSSPSSPVYTTTVPARTSVTAFQAGGAQALGLAAGSVKIYWTATEATANSTWGHNFSGSNCGRQSYTIKSTTTWFIRPVRQLLI